MKKVLNYLIFLLVLTSTVNALGIAPSDTYISFEPYGAGSFEIMLINNGDESVNASVNLGGPFSEYFNMVNGVQEVKAGSSTKYIVEYSFPASLDLHGPVNHDLNVNQEITERKEGISASLVVVARVVVDVPYPERYLEYGLSVEDVNEGEELNFNFNIANKGEGNIFGFKSNLIIYDPSTEEKLFEVEDSASSLISGVKVTKTINVDSSEIGGGTFVADSFVTYDGIETDHRNITFKVGYEDVEVIEYPFNATFGGIRKLMFVVDNKWNIAINDVVIETYIEKNGVPITERSISNGFDLKALGEKNVPVYLDISNVNQGAYQLVVTIKYNGSEKIQKFDFSVISDKKFFTKEMVAGILIVCLIFANFLWLTLRKKGHISDKKEDYSNKMDQLQDKLGK